MTPAQLKELVEADIAAGGRGSLETDAAILAIVPERERAAVAARLKMKPKYSARDYAIMEAADLARKLRSSTGDNDQACRLASATMAARGWTIKVEQIYRAEFQRRNQAVNAIRAARKLYSRFFVE